MKKRDDEKQSNISGFYSLIIIVLLFLFILD